MDTVLNTLFALGLLILIVLILYLVDRVNTIEKETRQVLARSHAKPEPPKPVLEGMPGRVLWDIMTGKEPPGMDAATVAEIRERYDIVVHKHMEWLYKEGLRDGPRGLMADPTVPHMVNTARGQVESWLPGAQAKTLYQCGLDASQTPVTGWAPIRQSMDEAAQIVYSRTQIEPRQSLSSWLMPDPAAVQDPAQGPVQGAAPGGNPQQG